MEKTKLDYEYFLKPNFYNILIEKREGRSRQYVVWEKDSIVTDCLTKKEAYKLALSIFNEIDNRYRI